MYQYTMLHSLGMDGDMDLRNNHKKIGDPWKLGQLDTKAYGLPKFKYGYHKWVVGDAFLRLPFFWTGQLIARWVHKKNPKILLDGRSLITQGASCFASVFYAFLGLLLAFFMLRHAFGTFAACCGCGIIWLGSNLFFYTTYYSSYQHAISFFTMTAFLSVGYFRFWVPFQHFRARREDALPVRVLPHWSWFLLVGCLGGLNAIVRMENAPLAAWLAFPFVLHCMHCKPHRSLSTAWGLLWRWSLVIIGYLSLLSVQLGYWYWNTGYWIVNHSGEHYLRFEQPFLWELWFSSRNGMFTYSPVFFIAWIGWVVALRRSTLWTVSLLALFGWVSFLNASSTFYWGAFSYGTRRAVAISFVFMWGVAACIHAFSQMKSKATSRMALGLLSLPIIGMILYAQMLMYEHSLYRSIQQTPNTVARLSKHWLKKTGNPFQMPYNWYFAWKHGIPIERYERIVSYYPVMLPPKKMKKGFRKTGYLWFPNHRSRLLVSKHFRLRRYRGRTWGITLQKGQMGRILIPIHYNALCYRFKLRVHGVKSCKIQADWNRVPMPDVWLPRKSTVLSFQPKKDMRTHGINHLELRAQCTLHVRYVKITAFVVGMKQDCFFRPK